MTYYSPSEVRSQAKVRGESLGSRLSCPFIGLSVVAGSLVRYHGSGFKSEHSDTSVLKLNCNLIGGHMWPKL